MTQPSQPGKPGLVQASSLLFIMMMGNNVFNYAFHALASRRLGPSDYGAFVSMMALLTILSVPSQTIQTVVAKWAAVEELSGRYDRISAMAVQGIQYLFVVGGFLLVGLGLCSNWLVDFFRLTSGAPIWAVGITIVVMLVIPVLRGLQQGLQRFNALGLNLFIDGFVRIVSGFFIFWIGWKVAGGILATALGGAVSVGIALISLPELRRTKLLKTKPVDLSGLQGYSIGALFCFSAYLALSTLDIIMVKHYFVPEIAGHYAAASMIGKGFLFLPFAVANVLFSKASAHHAREENAKGLLLKSLGLTAAILLGSVGVVWFLAPWIVETLFGHQYVLPQTIRLVQWFGLAVTPLALVFILMQYNLALQKRGFVMLLILDIPVFLALLYFFHGQLELVLTVAGVNHFVLFVAGYFLTPHGKGA